MKITKVIKEILKIEDIIISNENLLSSEDIQDIIDTTALLGKYLINCYNAGDLPPKAFNTWSESIFTILDWTKQYKELQEI